MTTTNANARMTADRRAANALARAAGRKAHATTDPTAYRCYSAHHAGVVYQATVTAAGEVVCNCPAADFAGTIAYHDHHDRVIGIGSPCWHAAATIRRLARERAISQAIATSRKQERARVEMHAAARELPRPTNVRTKRTVAPITPASVVAPDDRVGDDPAARLWERLQALGGTCTLRLIRSIWGAATEAQLDKANNLVDGLYRERAAGTGHRWADQHPLDWRNVAMELSYRFAQPPRMARDPERFPLPDDGDDEGVA